MCRGILDYARRHGPWRCHLVEGRPEEQFMNLKKERFDGIIAAGGSHRENDGYASVGVPFVLLEPRPGNFATAAVYSPLGKVKYFDIHLVGQFKHTGK